MATNNSNNFTNPISVNTGGTGDSSVTAYSVICGGTTSTGNLQNVSGVGSSTQILTSGGSSALPTWTTPTGAPVLVASVTLTSTQVKALHATPIDLIPAQGAGTFIVVIFTSAKFIYGGSNVFVAGASQTIAPYYNANSGFPITQTSFVSNAMIVGNSSRYVYQYTANNAVSTLANLENVAVKLYNWFA